MSKAIPPIRPNPRHGKEVATEAAVTWGGAQPKPAPAPADQVPAKRRPSAPAKQPGQPGRPRRTGRRNPQQNFRIADPEGLVRLAKKKKLSKTGVINLLIAEKLDELGL